MYQSPQKGLTFSIWVHVQNTKAERIGQIISILCSVLLTFFFVLSFDLFGRIKKQLKVNPSIWLDELVL